ncbi:MAG TPA: tetratricopeptide repeat protein [Phycisphaerae bacterium]|nr:tetratricopeptide repeat protein [Phycisphaerae bacterium]
MVQSSISEPGKKKYSGRQLLAALGLILLCFVVYWPLLHAGFIWDDGLWITENPYVQHWSGLWHIWFSAQGAPQYYPLVTTAFLLEYKWFGLIPVGYHLVNIFLQSSNAILLWRILRRLELKGAWVAAAVFAIHPVQVETVGWITEQKNLLSVLLGFSAALYWLKWSDSNAPGETELLKVKQRWKPYSMATAFYALALLAKTDLCVLPAILLLLYWWKSGGITRIVFVGAIPWLIIGFMMAGITIFIENGQAGAHGEAFGFSLAQRFIIAGKDFWFYPLKLLWPHPLMEVYPRWNVDHLSWVDCLFPTTALAIPAILWLLRTKIGRGPFTAAAYYGIAIFPVLGFISFFTMEYSFAADHYQYMACIGVITLVVEGTILLVSLITTGWKNKNPTEAGNDRTRLCKRTTMIGIAAILLAMLGCFTIAQGELYNPSVNIWRNVLEYDPHSWVALGHLGEWQAAHEDPTDALATIKQAEKYGGASNVYVTADLGNLYMRAKGDYRSARFYLLRSLLIQPYQPDIFAELAYCDEKLGDSDQAITDLKLAQALEESGDTQDAIVRRNIVLQLMKRLTSTNPTTSKLMTTEPNFLPR